MFLFARSVKLKMFCSQIMSKTKHEQKLGPLNHHVNK